MESQAARRRINTISGHLAARIATEDVTSTTTHLFPLNCSSNLSTPFRRFDSKLQFGRQASASQGYFMRQAVSSMEQGNQFQQARVCSAKGINEENSSSRKPPLFSRPTNVQPRFSRPADVESNWSNTATLIEPLTEDKMLPSPECPKFARPGGATRDKKQLSFRRDMLSSQINGIKWSPRINVAESKSTHVIAVELPGVDISDIRVEIDDEKITVKGKRSMKWWKGACCSNESFATFQKREISQGSYHVAWPLPAGVNRDLVSAEFVEGILHITIPKL